MRRSCFTKDHCEHFDVDVETLFSPFRRAQLSVPYDQFRVLHTSSSKHVGCDQSPLWRSAGAGIKPHQ